MEAICCGNMKAETASVASRRRGRRNGSLLLASELAASDAAERAAAYGRISRSRSCGRHDKIGEMKKNRALTFLMEVFSRNYMGCGGGGSTGVETADDAVVRQKKAKKEKGPPSSWLPDPHRRWPVQGW
ncbi:hypothetical protein DM860_017216 [Cuscuta australis]|uniref:Uncharacterized protein n=2 Tax=Cuscuta sect. Cleistogrammica TaxID=1824901 RepID=A0A328E3C1_9ASTE|nr:hypothetical protein DM860_017216 [Cuscuta australis]